MRSFVRFWVAALVACGALAAGGSQAQATLTMSPVPAYTKTNTNFNVFFQATKLDWQDAYRVCVWTYYRAPGGAWVLAEGQPGPPGGVSSVCTGNIVGSQQLKMWPYQPSTVLTEGYSYQLCAAGYYWSVGLIWVTEGGSLNCATTTIDRSRPTASVVLANGQPVTNSLSVPIRINYQDTISPPWPGPGGTASNWVCWVAGTSPCTPVDVSSHCSVPASNTTSTHFNCLLTVPGEGDYTVCTVVADSGMPDSPNAPWNGQASSSGANLSLRACGSVRVDTTGPTVTASANAVNVTVGQLVTFSAAASDPAGTTGAFTWDFGDNTAPGSGATTTHTYTQPGTFVARATTADGLGNPGSGTVTITVTGTPGGGTPGGTTPGGTTPGGTTPPTGGGAPLPGTGAGTVTPAGSPALRRNQVRVTGAVLAVAPTSAAAVARAAGGGATRVVVMSTLRITTPRAFTSGKLRLPMTVTLRRRGSVNVTLLKGTKRIAAGTFTATKAGTAGLVLRVPRTLAPGAYTIRVVHRPVGAAAITRNLPLTVRRPPAKKKAKETAVAGIPLS